MFLLKHCPDHDAPSLRAIGPTEASARLYVNSLNALAHPNHGLDAVARSPKRCRTSRSVGRAACNLCSDSFRVEQAVACDRIPLRHADLSFSVRTARVRSRYPFPPRLQPRPRRRFGTEDSPRAAGQLPHRGRPFTRWFNDWHATIVLNTMLAPGSHAAKLLSLPWNLAFPPPIPDRYSMRYQLGRIARLLRGRT